MILFNQFIFYKNWVGFKYTFTAFYYHILKGGGSASPPVSDVTVVFGFAVLYS